jgi:hypothetical protein
MGARRELEVRLLGGGLLGGGLLGDGLLGGGLLPGRHILARPLPKLTAGRSQ